ncbi:hypothetical protein [Herbidospora mongoliensis]|uniref:hypothetical protein n=1 Tax=Herbidospora mongoliensis TaxID=688067 RepID=UPI0008348AE5|nr:hypothetical protein [Herbidospora mongoliensis]
MDAKQMFGSLATQEQPPTTVDVNRAMAAGRAVRGRRRAAVAGTTAVITAVVAAGMVHPWVRKDDVAVSATPSVTPSATPSATPWPTYEGFAERKKQTPPKGKIAYVPPLLMWVSDAPVKNQLFLCEIGPNGSSCSGFRPIPAKEFARTQGKLRRVDVWFGVAKDAVHAVTAVTRDGRKVPGVLTRGVSPGIGLWSVEYPPGAAMRSLVFTGAKGETLQRIAL